MGSHQEFSDNRRNFQRTATEPSAWRDAANTSLKRRHRDEHLAKRRFQPKEGFDLPAEELEDLKRTVDALAGEGVALEVEEDLSPTPPLPDSWGHNMSTDQLAQLMSESMPSNSFDVKYAALKRLRRMVCRSDPPYATLVGLGIISILANYFETNCHGSLMYEAAWCLINIASQSSEYTGKVVEANLVPKLVALLSTVDREVCEQIFWVLGNVAGDSPAYRDMVVSAGVMRPLEDVVNNVEELYADAPIKTKVNCYKLCAWFAANLVRGRPVPGFEFEKVIIDLLQKLLHGSQHPDVLSDATWGLVYLTDDKNGEGAGECISEILYTGLGYKLTELVKSTVNKVRTPAIRAVGNIVLGNEEQTDAMLLGGALKGLHSVIAGSFVAGQKREAMWAVSNILAGSQIQIQNVINEGVFQDITFQLQHGETTVKEECTWSVINAFVKGTPEQNEAILKYGVLAPFVAYASSGMKATNRIFMSLKAIDAMLTKGGILQHMNNVYVNPFIAVFEQAGGLRFLQQMLDLVEMAVYAPLISQAQHIMNTHLSGLQEDSESDWGVWEKDGLER